MRSKYRPMELAEVEVKTDSIHLSANKRLEYYKKAVDERNIRFLYNDVAAPDMISISWSVLQEKLQ